MGRFPIIRSHAPWHKTLLIPIWILELGFMIAVFALALASLTRNGNYRNYLNGNATSYAENSSGATTVLGIDTGLSVTSIVLTFAEALRLANRSLSPALFLLSNIIKLVLFIALVSLDGDGIGRGYDQHRAGGIAAVIIDSIAVFTILVALLYAIIVLINTRRVHLSSNYGTTLEDADKPSPIYRTNSVPMINAIPNTVIEPDIAYNTQSNNRYQNLRNGPESYMQTSGIATPAPRYQSYYSTDPLSPCPRIHELEHVGNVIRPD